MAAGNESSPRRLSAATNTFTSEEFLGARGNIEKDIAKHEQRAKHVLRRAALANSDKLLDRELLKEAVSESEQRWLGCLMLPVTLLFFTFYSIAASLHEDVVRAHLMEAPIRAKLMPPLDVWEDATPDMLQGVSTIPEAYHFIENTYLPLLFKQTDALGKPLPRDEWSKLFEYNQLESMVIMELQRSEKVKCSGESTKNLWCYPQGNLTNKPFGLDFNKLPGGNASHYTGGKDPILSCADEGFTVVGCGGRRLAVLRDDVDAKMPPAGTEEDTYRFLLNPNTTYFKVQQRFQYLKDRGWLDDRATRLVLKAYYVNSQMEVPRMQAFEVTFFFSRGGGVFTTIRFMGIALETWSEQASIVFDILFVSMLFSSTCFLLQDFCKAAIRRNVGSHFHFVHVITWLSVIVGWFIAFELISSVGWRNELISKLEAYRGSPSEANALAYSRSVAEVSASMQVFRVIVADAHILFMVRCFASLKWQPRLAVVMRTISVMSSDLLHFLIVLIPTFLAFAIAGMMMFGRRLKAFTTLQAAMATCFEIAMESQFDWGDLSAQDFWTSVTWVWVYLLLVVLLMLNMVLAIIMDVYQEVRREAGNTMTLTRHIEYLFNVFRYRKSWIPYNTLYSAICQMPKTISLLELRQAFPSMPDYQGAYLTKECFNKAKRIARVGVDTSVTEQLVAAIHVSLEEVLNDVADMKKRGWMGMGLEIPNSSDRETVKDILTSVSTQQHWMALTQKNMSALQAKIDGAAAEELEPGSPRTPRDEEVE